MTAGMEAELQPCRAAAACSRQSAGQHRPRCLGLRRSARPTARAGVGARIAKTPENVALPDAIAQRARLPGGTVPSFVPWTWIRVGRGPGAAFRQWLPERPGDRREGGEARRHPAGEMRQTIEPPCEKPLAMMRAGSTGKRRATSSSTSRDEGEFVAISRRRARGPGMAQAIRRNQRARRDAAPRLQDPDRTPIPSAVS